MDDDLLHHYLTGRRLPDGRLAAVEERLYNAALIVGLSGAFYDKHY